MIDVATGFREHVAEMEIIRGNPNFLICKTAVFFTKEMVRKKTTFPVFLIYKMVLLLRGTRNKNQKDVRRNWFGASLGTT